MHWLESEETQMIKIERPKDLRIFRDKPNIPPLIVRYLTDYLYFFLREYQCPDMTEFGAFFLLENRQDSCHQLGKYQRSGAVYGSGYDAGEKGDDVLASASFEKQKKAENIRRKRR